MVLISKTPLRISFFGGGTDYPEYYKYNKGGVLGMAINKYIYIASIDLNGIQDYNYRVAYSRLEQVNNVDDIKHPVVKALLKDYGIKDPLDISIMSDMPAGSGLGSSSSFTVGLVNLLKKRSNIQMTKLDVALEAIRIEKEVLAENVGIQDQLHASFGGINRFEFYEDNITVTPITMRGDNLQVLTNSLFLVFTGIQRHASDVVTSQLANTKRGINNSYLHTMYEMISEAQNILTRSRSDLIVDEFSRLLNEAWKYKQKLGKSITSDEISNIIKLCRDKGASAVKLCGAGGGGFLLCLVPEEFQKRFIESLYPLKAVKIEIDVFGTQVN